MAFPLPIPPALRTIARPGASVLMALSGGVDSAVALALLVELGCEVEAVTFRNFPPPDAENDLLAVGRADRSLGASEAARRVAQLCGVRHRVVDVAAQFRAAVIDPFVTDYTAGRTPNPCIACNARVRFPELARLAERGTPALVATGHYARVAYDADGGAQLWRGLDTAKDQSYFLYAVGRDRLARAVFPLGWFRKEQVRAAAAALGLPVASRRESQEICFVPDDDRSFLFAGGEAEVPGEIVDREARVLGRHRGLAHYTVGQRRGLGIASPAPLYVLALDRDQNRLIVGPVDALDARRIACDDFVSAAPEMAAQGPPPGGRGYWARIRHRHAGAPVARWRVDGQRLDVELAAMARGIAPGQALVLYRDDLVLGGGRILAAF